MALLRFDGLSFAYPYAMRRTLQDVSFEMAEGEDLVLCGPSVQRTTRAQRGALGGGALGGRAES